ncbi:MAG: hypothetical protein M0P64_02235 [Candidatus Pacebacteria bacterium]|jgi:hypothetical protein|nr:hypothetical protein [Candidatus Paceibacterota bacterium]
MKKILGGLVVLGVFLGGTSVALAVLPCAAVPSQYKNVWTDLPASAQQSYYDIYCSPGTGSTGASGSTGSGATLSANTKLQNPIKYSTFSEFAAAITKTAVQVLLPFIVLAFIYSGFLFVKAQGNEKELEEAKQAIWYSLIGAFILLGAWGFAQIISQTVSTITQ